MYRVASSPTCCEVGGVLLIDTPRQEARPHLDSRPLSVARRVRRGDTDRMAQPETNASGSPVFAAPDGVLEEIRHRVQWLVGEQESAETEEQRALLFFEAAAARERIHDEAGAARDYLASYNANPDFCEPVESLASLLDRRKSYKNLGKLLEALARFATTPQQIGRASMLRGAFLVEHDNDADGARTVFEQAVASDPDLAAAWLELEINGGQTGDANLRIQSLEERARLAEPDPWKALLLLDLAKELQARGEIDRSLDLIRTAASLDSPYRYRAALVLEQLARREHRDDLTAEALQEQANTILAVMQE